MGISKLPGKVLTAVYLLTELVLFGFVLTADGELLIWSSYLSIVLCFLFALIHVKQGSKLIIGGLALTVAADFCLVVCSPIQQVWGMVFFLGAQILYATLLHVPGSRKLLIFRLGLSVLAMMIAVLVLGKKTDALALISVCYYANLIVNILAAFTRFLEYPLFAVGLVLFILCDTVIGLQVASGGYLPIPEGSVLHQILFVDFNLSWFFYLPSQVLISLTSRNKR